MAPIPITIVTGFLGSGKTTLLLNLLPQLRETNPSYKLALLKNEFGDVAVDSELASSSSISGVKELLNGCICCNMVGQLDTALEELLEKVSPDRIVLETSGSAFPATLAMEVNRLARQTGKFALDGVVTVIDVENWKGYEDTSFTAKAQAKYTDLVVFNKWELVDERRFDECLDRLGDMDIPIAWVKSDKGKVPADVVFGVDGGLAKSLGETQEEHSHSHDHAKGKGHQSEVEVLSVTLKAGEIATIAAEKLMKLLNTAPKDEVYRIKGLVSSSVALKGSDEAIPVETKEGVATYILNWAFGRWTFTPLKETAEPLLKSNEVLRMTLILARYESSKWKKRLEKGELIALESDANGDLTVEKIV
jgi:G3E family GTPase